MFTARALLTKWLLYAAAVAFLLLGQELLLDEVLLLGVVPFLPPMIVGVVAALEGSTQGTIFGVAFGFFCDLLLGGVFPGVYTLSFFIVALCISLISASWVMPNVPGSLLYALVSFALVDLVQGLFLLAFHSASLSAIASLSLREAAVSFLFVIPVFLLFRFLHNLFRYD